MLANNISIDHKKKKIMRGILSIYRKIVKEIIVSKPKYYNIKI